MALNQCTFLGRLTRDPDIWHATETQMPIARFTLAVGRGTKKDGETEADFINCVAFDKKAEFAERYLEKGTRVLVSGRMKNNNYIDKDGNKVYGMELQVVHVEYADGWNEKKEEEKTPSSETDTPPRRGAATQRSAARPSASARGKRPNTRPSTRMAGASEGFMNIPDGVHEDLPFN